MNKICSRLTKAMLLLFVAVGFVSCNSEDDLDPMAIKSINAEYSVKLNQLWFDYYDIEIQYRDERGELSSFALTDPKGWSYSFSLKPEKAPQRYCFKVLATPKKDYPDIDNNSRYVFEKDITCEFYSLRNNGEVYKELSSDLAPYSGSVNDDESFNGSELLTIMRSNHTYTLCGFDRTWDGKY